MWTTTGTRSGWAHQPRSGDSSEWDVIRRDSADRSNVLVYRRNWSIYELINTVGYCLQIQVFAFETSRDRSRKEFGAAWMQYVPGS